MKKALILIIAGICLFRSTGMTQKTEVGITGGITSSNIYGKIGGLDTRGDSRTGFTVGMILDVPVGKTKITFQPGLHYLQKGEYTKKTSSEKDAVALRYAEFQFNFIKYSGKSNRIFLGIGPTLGLNLPSKKVVITDNSRTETSLTFGKLSSNDYIGADWGANGVIGVRFKNNLYFAVNYTLGIRNQIPVPSGDDHLRNGCLGIRLGCFFKNQKK
jgi:hypothetical protein